MPAAVIAARRVLGTAIIEWMSWRPLGSTSPRTTKYQSLSGRHHRELLGVAAQMPEPLYLITCRIDLVERPVGPAGTVRPARKKVQEPVRATVEAGGHGLGFELPIKRRKSLPAGSRP
jgi:hypothetical protein